jgi:hypothetical protein
MRRLALGQEHPYGFHMCWTADKSQKLKFFREVDMWYLTPKCDLDDIIPTGKTGKRNHQDIERKGLEEVIESKSLMKMCCTNMKNAPRWNSKTA